MKHEDPYSDDIDHDHHHDYSVDANAPPKASNLVLLGGLSKSKPVSNGIVKKPSDGPEDDSTPSVTDSSTDPPKKRQRMMKWDLRFHTQRRLVRERMLHQVPGITKKHAAALVVVYPTLGGLLGAATTELANVIVGNSTLGQELAVALKRVFE